jgi:hypothetical protein
MGDVRIAALAQLPGVLAGGHLVTTFEQLGVRLGVRLLVHGQERFELRAHRRPRGDDAPGQPVPDSLAVGGGALDGLVGLGGQRCGLGQGGPGAAARRLRRGADPRGDGPGSGRTGR